jgi:hypothetical protein
MDVTTIEMTIFFHEQKTWIGEYKNLTRLTQDTDQACADELPPG